MHACEVEWVLARRREARVFPYFKDRYALLLLAWAAAEGTRVRALRRGRYAPLLEKPVVKALLANRGGVLPNAEALEAVRPDAGAEAYRVTLGKWGSADEGEWSPGVLQTSRPGLNLVLQLNFPKNHRRAYWGLIAPRIEDEKPDEHPWVNCGHPVHPREVTLSWARIDVAFDAGEALIEEVQSDWVRAAQAEARALEQLDFAALASEELWGFAPEVGPYHVLSYVRHVLEPHAKVWAEATLCAALQLVRELGIRRVFYNTHETGAWLKDCSPPRSLYEALPRRFCFERTEERPAALRRSRHPALRERLRRPRLSWYRLQW